MKVEILEIDEDKLTFVIEGCDISLLNSLRRAISSKVPCLALDHAIVTKNAPGIFDEFLIHRIGLIPWRSEIELVLPEKCNCEGRGCHKCELRGQLKKKGPGDVRAKDIKFSGAETPYPKILIAKINEGEEIELEAVLKLGTGEKHAKWQAGFAYYDFFPEIKVSGSAEKVVKSFPDGIFKIKNGKLIPGENFSFDLIDRYKEMSKNAIEIEENKNKFLFCIERTSGLLPHEVLLKAIDVLEDNVESFEEEYRKAKS